MKSNSNLLVLTIVLAFVPNVIAAIYIYANASVGDHPILILLNPIMATAVLWLIVTYLVYRRVHTRAAAWLFALFPIAFFQPILIAYGLILR